MTDTPAPIQPIHIALTFDDNFWAPACAVIRSALLSTKRRADLVFHLVVHEIAPEHLDDINSIAEEFSTRFNYYELNDYPDFIRVCGPLRASKRFPPERDILFICCSRVQPFLPFGEITVLKRQLRQSIRLIASFGIVESSKLIEESPHRRSVNDGMMKYDHEQVLFIRHLHKRNS